MRLCLALLLFAWGLAPVAAAQTTHQVRLTGFAFSRPDLTVCAGDTVQWFWDVGRHNVESGLDGVGDGHFRSGPLETAMGQSFSVTFDAAFLAAHPEPGNVYDYFCAAHWGLGMVGKVTVLPPAAVVIRNGSGTNPLSLTATGRPELGRIWRVTLDCSAHAPGRGAYFGYQAPRSRPLALSAGELLLEATSGQVFLRVGSHGGGALVFEFAVPDDPALCGTTLYTQGSCSGAPGTRLSNALDATAGR